MNEQNTTNSVFKHKMFKILAKEFEQLIENKNIKEKEIILDLLENQNELRSYKEFTKISPFIRRALEQGDLELLEVLLSKKVNDESVWMTFKINKAKKTASLFRVIKKIDNLIVPRSIKYESEEYLITSIVSINQNHLISNTTKTVEFDAQSAVQTIYEKSFGSPNLISLHIPKSLTELKEGWCIGSENLTDIEISPSNKNFVYEDGKYLLGKTDQKSDKFDVLLFARRDIAEAIIPSNIKIIGPYAFSLCKNLKKVEFSENSNLQIIKKFAFEKTSIEDIIIPKNVTKICKCAFCDCTNLQKIDIEDHSNLQKIGHDAFKSTKITKICIPPSVSQISKYAFSFCVDLQKVEIPENSNLQKIGERVFAFTKVEHIFLPKSLMELDECFLSNINLKTIEISPLNDRFKFIDNKYLLGKTDPNGTDFDLLIYLQSIDEDEKIPDNIKVIGSYAFSSCKKLKKVEFSENSNLKIIEKYAFYRSSIESIFIPKNVTKICNYAFSWCQYLRKVEIAEHSNLQIIGEYAFQMTEITGICIPPSVLEICQSAFDSCNKLQKVEIPENSNLQKIGKNAFSQAPITKIYLPKSFTGFEEAEISSSKLEMVEISPLNKNYVYKDDKYLLGKTDQKSDEFDVILFARRDIEEAIIPSNIKVIGTFSFSFCQKLKKVEFSENSNLQIIERFAFSRAKIEKISIPASVTKICERAFLCCSLLEKVEIPKNSSLQIIENAAFQGAGITDIFIPPSITTISKNTFYRCDHLQKIEIPENSNLQKIESNSFIFTQIEKLYIPKDFVEFEQDSLSNMVKLKAFIVSPLNTRFVFIDNTFLLGKSEPKTNVFDVIMFARRDAKNVKIPQNVTVIGPCSFESCKKLTKIEFSKNQNLQIIKKFAFSNSNIPRISIPSTVTKICKNSFNNCRCLNVVDIPENSKLESIGECAFSSSKITQICIPISVKRIGFRALSSNNIKIVEIADAALLDFLDKSFYGNTILMVPFKNK